MDGLGTVCTGILVAFGGFGEGIKGLGRGLEGA